MRTFKNTLSFTIALTSILFLLATTQASAHDTHRSHRHYSNSHHKHQHSKHHRHHKRQHRRSTYTHKHRDNYYYNDYDTTVVVTDNLFGSTVVVSSSWCPSHRLYHTHAPQNTYYHSTYSTVLNPIVSSYRKRENGQCYQVNVDSYGNKTMTLLDHRACY